MDAQGCRSGRTEKMKSQNPFISTLDANRRTELNFVHWFRNLKIVFNMEHIGYILNFPIPGPLPKGALEGNMKVLKSDERMTCKRNVTCLLL